MAHSYLRKFQSNIGDSLEHAMRFRFRAGILTGDIATARKFMCEPMQQCCVNIVTSVGRSCSMTEKVSLNSNRKLPCRGDTSIENEGQADVGPVMRRLPTKAHDFYGSLDSLTL